MTALFRRTIGGLLAAVGVGMVAVGPAHAMIILIDYELQSQQSNPSDNSLLHSNATPTAEFLYFLSGNLRVSVNDSDNNGLDVGDTFSFLGSSSFDVFTDAGLTSSVDSFQFDSGDTFELYDVGGLLRPGLAGNQSSPATINWMSTLNSGTGSMSFLPLEYTTGTNFFNSMTQEHLALWGVSAFGFDTEIGGVDLIGNGTLIPEPSSLLLVGSGALLFFRRRRRA